MQIDKVHIEQPGCIKLLLGQSRYSQGIDEHKLGDIVWHEGKLFYSQIGRFQDCEQWPR